MSDDSQPDQPDQPGQQQPPVMPQSPPYAPQAEPPWADQQPAWPPPSPQPPPPVAPPPVAPPPPSFAAQPRSARSVAAVVVALALLCAAVGYGVGSSLAHNGTKTSPSAQTSPTGSAGSAGSSDSLPAVPSPSTNGAPSGSTLSNDDIAQKVDPAIVDINVTFTQGSGAGTGMVLTSSGLVLTNNHVIADATKIEAQSVTTGDTWTAKVLGYDITDDVALLQLDGASGLPKVSVGNSDNVQVGDRVVALGNALGQGGAPAVSPGTVRQLDQSIDVANEDGTSSTLSGLIETSARLQPGDSGGPLVDTSGSVIGMDAAATTSRRGGTANDSYAIPINTALDIAHQIENGQGSAKIHVGERGLLGIQSNDGRSATVAAVEPDSPADKAGISAGDTITSIDGTAVRTVNDVVSALDTHHPGDTVKVTWVDGNGNSHQASLELIAGPPA